MVTLARREDSRTDHSCRDERFRRSITFLFPAPMKILLVHNTYQQAGGEDIVVEQERRLLEQNGHKVSIYQRSNHEINSLSFGQRLGLLGRVVSASDSSKAVREILQTLKPDLVHVHNTFID